MPFSAVAIRLTGSEVGNCFHSPRHFVSSPVELTLKLGDQRRRPLILRSSQMRCALRPAPATPLLPPTGILSAQTPSAVCGETSCFTAHDVPLPAMRRPGSSFRPHAPSNCSAHSRPHRTRANEKGAPGAARSAARALTHRDPPPNRHRLAREAPAIIDTPASAIHGSGDASGIRTNFRSANRGRCWLQRQSGIFGVERDAFRQQSRDDVTRCRIPRSRTGILFTCSRACRACVKSASLENTNPYPLIQLGRMLAVGSPAPCSSTLRMEPRSILKANASRSSFSSGDVASRVKSKATNSIGFELASCTLPARCGAIARRLPPQSLPCRVPSQSSARESSCPCRFQWRRETAVRASSLRPLPELKIFQAANRQCETAPYRLARHRNFSSQWHFVGNASCASSSGSAVSRVMMIESPSALTFHVGLAARNDAAATSALSSVPS